MSRTWYFGSQVMLPSFAAGRRPSPDRHRDDPGAGQDTLGRLFRFPPQDALKVRSVGAVRVWVADRRPLRVSSAAGKGPVAIYREILGHTTLEMTMKIYARVKGGDKAPGRW